MIQAKQNQKVDYLVMSDKVCVECNQPIKQNIVDRVPNVKLCFTCFKLSQGKRYYTKSIKDKVGVIQVIRIDRFEIQKQNIKKYRK